jgi:hypothetical protein
LNTSPLPATNLLLSLLRIGLPVILPATGVRRSLLDAQAGFLLNSLSGSMFLSLSIMEAARKQSANSFLYISVFFAIKEKKVINP